MWQFAVWFEKSTAVSHMFQIRVFASFCFTSAIGHLLMHESLKKRGTRKDVFSKDSDFVS